MKSQNASVQLTRRIVGQIQQADFEGLPSGSLYIKSSIYMLSVAG
jgi:hypothetical protein